jgi:hypothetical protein
MPAHRSLKRKIADITLIQETGARITTRQFAKYEYNSGLASKNTNPLASLALTDSFCIFG